ncbi:MAG: protein rep [Alphaproteobacteria bacterium]|nr:protein rep [Alphaproteobacteria bacterium]
MTGPEKGLPSSSDKQEGRKQSSGVEALEKRLARYGNAAARQRNNLGYLAQLLDAGRHSTPDMLNPVWPDVFKYVLDDELKALKAKLENCGEWLQFRRYKETGSTHLYRASLCRIDLLCPLCAIQRGAKHLRNYKTKFEVIRMGYPRLIPVLLTLTIKNGFDLQERIDHLFRSVEKIKGKRRNAKSGGRCQSEFSKIAGAVGSYEISYSEKHGWHPHLHIVVFLTDWIDQKALSEEWLAITGDSKIVDVRLIDETNLTKSLNEIFKYALKFHSLTPAQAFECYLVLKNRKKLFSLGVMRGVQMPKSNTMEGLEDEAYDELQYWFRDGKYKPSSPAAKKLHGGDD